MNLERVTGYRGLYIYIYIYRLHIGVSWGEWKIEWTLLFRVCFRVSGPFKRDSVALLRATWVLSILRPKH